MAGRADLDSVLETALYYPHEDRAAVTRFYEEVLGLSPVAGWEDGTAYRIGSGVLLLFDIEQLARRDSPIADHGATGPGHACFVASAERYERLREGIERDGVEIVHEHEWRDGMRSFYFRDPVGNLLEIASGDLWPR